MAILSLLAGASLAAAPLPAEAPLPPLVTQQSVAQHPALWVVNDDDTIIYLFGTFHALDGKSDWFEQAVKTAFSASDELMLETLIPDSLRRPASAPSAMVPSLSGRSDPLVKLAPSASSMLASSRTIMRAGQQGGMSTDRGADAILRDAADATGKPVGGL